MAAIQPHLLKTITEYHEFMELPKPEHPLISVVNFEGVRRRSGDKPKSLINNFYTIALKRNFQGKMIYGQSEYDFDEGVMLFLAPGQVFNVQAQGEITHTGWMLLIHPDFIWNTPLAKKIKHYEYFSYSVHEALHLSEKEEIMLIGIIQHIAQEYRANIDAYSQDVIVMQIELLLTYAERYYNRQFLTRKKANHKILEQLEDILTLYFNSDAISKAGLPTVGYIAEELNVSPNYLGGLLKTLTGQNAQQHIHLKLIDIAKEKLSTTSLSVSEIAYELGFEHSQSFSKLFKNKTSLSPLAFRHSFFN